jgi:hypothetical protein
LPSGPAIGTAVIASAGSAQEYPRTLHLVGTAHKRIGIGPDRKPRHGDRSGGGSKIAGDDTGISRSVCTMIGKRALGAVQLQLSRGKPSAQGLVPQRADDTPLAITGGTGVLQRGPWSRPHHAGQPEEDPPRDHAPSLSE